MKKFILISLICLVYAVSNVYLLPYITFLGIFVLNVIMLVLLGGMLLWSIILLPKRKLMRDRVLPLCIMLMSLLSYFCIKKFYLVEKMDFYLNRNNREAIVSEIEKGVYQQEINVINLTGRNSNHIISQGNRVIVYSRNEKIAEFFYRNQGFLDEVTGYLHMKNCIDIPEDIQVLIEFDDEWSYCQFR